MVNSSDPHPSADASGSTLHSEHDRNEAYITAINSRIARLAIALHVPLAREEDVQAALHALTQEAAPAVVQPPQAHYEAGDTQHRTQALRNELRALLVMRYGAEQRFVEQLGVQAAREIMAEAEAHLRREGFQPGADGVNLGRLFDS